MKSLDKLRECRVVFIRDGKSIDPVELADEIQREVDEGYEPKPVGYELLPCPMCGQPFTQVRWIGFTHTHNGAFTAGYRGECCDCGLTTRAFDTESEAVAAWNMRAESGSEINGDTSDGYHTFDELYHHRAVLFSVIVRDHRELAWKSRKHYDGTMYDGMFIVGIETPNGQATYHCDLDPYWEMFDCEELEFAPEWDGHTPDEAIARIASLNTRTDDYKQAAEYWRRMYEQTFAERTCKPLGTIRYDYEDGYAGTEYETELSCGHKWRDGYGDYPDYCPTCGARVVDEYHEDR